MVFSWRGDEPGLRGMDDVCSFYSVADPGGATVKAIAGAQSVNHKKATTTTPTRAFPVAGNKVNVPTKAKAAPVAIKIQKKGSSKRKAEQQGN